MALLIFMTIKLAQKYLPNQTYVWYNGIKRMFGGILYGKANPNYTI